MSPVRVIRTCLLPLLLGVLATGCGSGQAPGEQPSWRRPPEVATSSAVPREIRLAPLAPAVLAYNDPPFEDAPGFPVADAVLAEVEEVAARVGRRPPRADGRLYAAVAELARIAPPDAPLPYSLVEFALQRHGIIEPAPHLVVIWGPDDPEVIVEKLGERLPVILESTSFARLGAATAWRPEVGETVTLLAFQPSFVTTDRIPRSAPLDGWFLLEGAVLEPYTQPQVFATRPGGAVETVDVTRTGSRGFRARIGCGGRQGRHQLEITASDESGSTVMANFPVWCGEEPPRSLAVTVSQAEAELLGSARDAAALLTALVNRDRSAHGLAPLEVDPRLEEVALAHSVEMFETGVVAHISRTTGSASDRVARGGIRSSVVLENVARAYGVGEAQEGLMNSPGHRANILAPQATHVGIGVVLGEETAGRRELFITQLFIRRPGKVDLDAASGKVEEEVQRHGSFKRSPALTEAARRFARDVAAGMPSREASARATTFLRERSSGYEKVTTLVTTVSDLAAFDPADTLADERIRDYGVGVAQGDHPEMGEGSLFVVLLLGH